MYPKSLKSIYGTHSSLGVKPKFIGALIVQENKNETRHASQIHDLGR